MKNWQDKIENLKQADQVLYELAGIQSELEKIDTDAGKQVASIKEKAAIAGEDLRNRLLELEQVLLLYAQYHKDELFAEKRSVDLTFGKLSFHHSTRISIKGRPEEKSTLFLLKKLFKGKAIRLKEEVNKDELKDWPSEKLAQINAKREERDNFGYELDRQAVNEGLLEAEAR